MTNQDAIRWLDNLKNDIGNPHYERLWHYAQAIDEIMELLEEQEAKTVIAIEKRFNDCDLTGYCPFCSRPLIKDWAENYCGYCGKPVLWEGRRNMKDLNKDVFALCVIEYFIIAGIIYLVLSVL